MSARPVPRDAQRELYGNALMLLLAVLGGLLLAAVLRGFQNVLYLPIVMPLFAGWVLGTAIARVRVRFVVPARGPAIAAALLGAAVAYGAYHLMVYAHVMDFLVAELATFEDRLASDPALEVQRWLELETGETGFSAYLAFVGRPENAAASPLGALSRLGLSAGAAAIAVAIEAGLVVTAAVGLALLRSRGVESASAVSGSGERRVREIVARVDASTLADAMEAVDAGKHETAGRLLGAAPGRGFVIAVVHDPFSADPWVLEVRDSAAPGELGPVRVRRELPSWDGQTLLDTIRLAAQKNQ